MWAGPGAAPRGPGAAPQPEQRPRTFPEPTSPAPGVGVRVGRSCSSGDRAARGARLAGAGVGVLGRCPWPQGASAPGSRRRPGAGGCSESAPQPEATGAAGGWDGLCEAFAPASAGAGGGCEGQVESVGSRIGPKRRSVSASRPQGAAEHEAAGAPGWQRQAPRPGTGPRQPPHGAPVTRGEDRPCPAGLPTLRRPRGTGASGVPALG